MGALLTTLPFDWSSGGFIGNSKSIDQLEVEEKVYACSLLVLFDFLYN